MLAPIKSTASSISSLDLVVVPVRNRLPVIETITVDMCKDYYNTYFHPNIAYLAIIGDIDVDDAEELVEKYFGSWKQKEVPTFEYAKVDAPLANKVALVNRPNAVQSTIKIAYPVNLEKFGDEAIKATVMNHLIGGGASGEFFEVLREEKGYTYGAYSSIAGDKLVGHFTASCDARNEVTDSAVTAFLDVMNKFRSEKISEEKLQAAKNYLTGSFSRALESPQTVARFALNIARYNLPSDYYKTYLQKLNGVTSEDIQQLAQKYITPDNAYIIVVGKADEVAASLEKFSADGKVFYYNNYGVEYDPSEIKIEEGVTAETVIEKYINAIGGRAKIEKITDLSTSMKASVQGMEVKIDVLNKAPNKYHYTFDMGVMKQVIICDGVKAKMIANGQETLMEGDELIQTKIEATLNAFLDYKSAGITTDLTGIEQVDGKDAYIVTLNLPNEITSLNYYDKESGLLVKQSKFMETPQGVITQNTFLGNYKEVEGVKYPFKISQSAGPQTIEMEVTSIKINSGISDTLFEIK